MYWAKNIVHMEKISKIKDCTPMPEKISCQLIKTSLCLLCSQSPSKLVY